MKDLKILNATFPDFRNHNYITADILADKGQILKISPAGTITEDTVETIDASDLIVSPGFVNIHGHEDLKEDSFFSTRCELLDGVTTIAGGNCGDNNWAVTDFVNYISLHGSPSNFCTFVGQNYLRQLAGADDLYRASTRRQLDNMKRHLTDICRKISPVGLSCGFEYSPGITTDETIELLQALDNPNYVTSIHSRADGPGTIAATQELVEISRRSGFAMQMSHIGSCSATGYMRQTLDILEAARADGVDITADCYPYNAFCTSIGSAVFDGDCFSNWNYNDIMMTDGPYKNQRCTREIFKKMRKETPDSYVVAFVMNEPEIELAYRQPYVMVGSDGIYFHGAGHPRGAGTFARILGSYVREHGVLTLLDALYKITLQPACRLNLSKKGDIREGMDADFTIFDPAAIRDKSTFEEASLPPEGIKYVIIGGKTAVKNNEIINSTLGTYVRSQPQA